MQINYLEIPKTIKQEIEFLQIVRVKFLCPKFEGENFSNIFDEKVVQKYLCLIISSGILRYNLKYWERPFIEEIKLYTSIHYGRNTFPNNEERLKWLNTKIDFLKHKLKIQNNER